jgi:CheY-like chemotaxis protein
VEYARTISSAGGDLLNLINDILDLSKVEAGRMDVVPAEVHLRDVCETVDGRFRPMADEKGLSFTVELDPSAPEAIVSDEQRLHQVLKNLLSNAVKFTETGSVKLHIGLASPDVRFTSPVLSRAGRVVAFTVHDTGIGISQEKLRLVFEAFQQADGTTSRKYGGTGLGLSISREIARLLGGEIRASSTAGESSTFIHYLPDTYEPPAETVPAPDQAVLTTDVLLGKGPGLVVEPAAASPPRVTVHEPVRASAKTAVEAHTPELADDRLVIGAGDRVLLVVHGDGSLGREALTLGRERGYKVLLTSAGAAALALAREFHPEAALLELALPGAEGGALLALFKQDAALRHIPIHVFGPPDRRHQSLRAGAYAYSSRPARPKDVNRALNDLVAYAERGQRHVLVVEDDDTERAAVSELLGTGDDVLISAVGSSEEAIEVLEKGWVDCVVLDLKLPKMSGFTLLELIKTDERYRGVPVIVYTGKALTRREETRLTRYAESIIVKDARSPERLLEEVTLFLHRPGDSLPEDQRLMLEQLQHSSNLLAGKNVLIVDDDVRNVFALTSVLERHGMSVIFAENGKDGLATLAEHPDVDLVLMDIMMPEMDGYETIAAIRSDNRFDKLPIIALTAKAMKGDREDSIAAGASDYITKPVDVDQLLSLVRVWLYA